MTSLTNVHILRFNQMCVTGAHDKQRFFSQQICALIRIFTEQFECRVSAKIVVINLYGAEMYNLLGAVFLSFSVVRFYLLCTIWSRVNFQFHWLNRCLFPFLFLFFFSLSRYICSHFNFYCVFWRAGGVRKEMLSNCAKWVIFVLVAFRRWVQ